MIRGVEDQTVTTWPSPWQPTDEDRLAPPVAPPPAAEPPPPPPPAPPSEAGRRGPRWVSVAVVAALVGAAVGAGVTAAADKGGSGSPTAVFADNTSKVAKPQDIQGILAKVEPGVVSIETSSYVARGGVSGGGGQLRVAGSGMTLTAAG